MPTSSNLKFVFASKQRTLIKAFDTFSLTYVVVRLIRIKKPVRFKAAINGRICHRIGTSKHKKYEDHAD